MDRQHTNSYLDDNRSLHNPDSTIDHILIPSNFVTISFNYCGKIIIKISRNKECSNKYQHKYYHNAVDCGYYHTNEEIERSIKFEYLQRDEYLSIIKVNRDWFYIGKGISLVKFNDVSGQTLKISHNIYCLYYRSCNPFTCNYKHKINDFKEHKSKNKRKWETDTNEEIKRQKMETSFYYFDDKHREDENHQAEYQVDRYHQWDPKEFNNMNCVSSSMCVSPETEAQECSKWDIIPLASSWTRNSRPEEPRLSVETEKRDATGINQFLLSGSYLRPKVSSKHSSTARKIPQKESSSSSQDKIHTLKSPFYDIYQCSPSVAPSDKNREDNENRKNNDIEEREVVSNMSLSDDTIVLSDKSIDKYLEHCSISVLEARIQEKDKIIEEQRLIIEDQKRELEINKKELEKFSKEIKNLEIKRVKYIKMIGDIDQENKEIKKELNNVICKYNDKLSRIINISKN